MRLVVVYGLKTDDYAYLRTFYPTRRLAGECEKRSVELRFLFPRDLPAFLAGADAGISGADIGAADFCGASSGAGSGVRTFAQADRAGTLFLVRGDVDDEVAALPEAAGFRSVNPSRARALANDKLAAAGFLESHGWPTPKTQPAAEAADEPFPLVAKPRFGSRGRGVRLIRDAGELAALPEGTIAQAYVQASRGRDLRALFAGGRILAAAIREAPRGELVSNACAGGKFRPAPPLPAYWRDIVRSIAAEAGLWYGSVDFLFTGNAPGGEGEANAPLGPESLTVCEINASPGFEALERDCGADIAGALVDALVADFG